MLCDQVQSSVAKEVRKSSYKISIFQSINWSLKLKFVQRKVSSISYWLKFNINCWKFNFVLWYQSLWMDMKCKVKKRNGKSLCSSEALFIQLFNLLGGERKMKIMQMLRIEKKDILCQSHMLQVFPLWSYLFRKKAMMPPDSASSVWARINPVPTGAARRTRGKTR